jgi:hypothetical protein
LLATALSCVSNLLYVAIVFWAYHNSPLRDYPDFPACSSNFAINTAMDDAALKVIRLTTSVEITPTPQSPLILSQT